MCIPILFEDASMLVIDKPVGLSVTDEEEKERFSTGAYGSVKDWVKRRFKYESSSSGAEDEFEQRFGIVHRLDKETSGVLLIAKTSKVFNYLKGLFKFRRINKEYQAIVYGIIKDDRFEISAPISRAKSNGTVYGVEEEGRDSVTEFRVLERYTAPFPSTYLLAYPRTGRTHQIRVHLKAYGHPVVNDHKYASRVLLPSSKNFANRMMLHAKSVTFVDWDGKKRSFESPTNLLDFFRR